MGSLAFTEVLARGRLRIVVAPIKKPVMLEARKRLSIELTVRRSG